MKKMRTLLALLMALVMVLSFAPTALMEGEIDHTVEVFAEVYDEGDDEEESAVLEFGHNLTDDDLKIAGVEVTRDEENNLIDVTVPAVEVVDERGAYVHTDADGAAAYLDVVDGVEVAITDGDWVDGVRVEAVDGTAAVFAGGVTVVNKDETDSWSGTMALDVSALDGEAYAAIGEDGVTVIEVTDATGVHTDAWGEEGRAVADVAGNVKITMIDGQATGIEADAYDKGVTRVSAEGVIILGEGTEGTHISAMGAEADAEEGGDASVAIGENGVVIGLVSNATGVSASAEDEKAEAFVEVDGLVAVSAIDYDAAGVRVYAYGKEAEADAYAEGVVVTRDGEEAEPWVETKGVSMNAYEGASASASIGEDGVTVDGGSYAEGVTAYASGEKSSVNLDVFGDVDVTGEETRAIGLEISAYDGAEANASVLGDINVVLENPVVPEDEEGMWPGVSGAYVSAGYDATADLLIVGDVTATGYYGTGLGVSAYGEGEASAVVLGDVLSDGLAMYASAFEGGIANLSVAGDVTGDSTGLVVYSENGGYPTVIVDGDVTGGYTGLQINGDENAIADVIISGTLSGVYNPIALSTGPEVWHEEADGEGWYTVDPVCPELVDVYVWKIDMPEQEEDAVLLNVADEAEEEDPLETFYKNNVHYIVKQEDQQGATLTLGGVYFYELGEDEDEEPFGFEYADESDVVTLNVALDRNYQLNGAYNGGEKLQKDADGNYYTVVERGGGVYLTLDLLKLYGTFQSSDGAKLEFISTKKCKFTKGDVIEYWNYRIENDVVIITNLAGVEMVIENVDGVWTLKYELANGDSGTMTFTKTAMGRILNF